MKDLDNNADLTAKIFNEKRAQRDADRDRQEEEEEERERQEAAMYKPGVRIVPVPSTSNGYTTVGYDGEH